MLKKIAAVSIAVFQEEVDDRQHEEDDRLQVSGWLAGFNG